MNDMIRNLRFELKRIWCLVLMLMVSFTLGLSQENEPTPIQEEYRSQIIQLGESDLIKQAFQTIEQLEPETKEDHIYLTEIPAPPFQEDTRARAFLDMMKSNNLDSAWIDEEGNAIGLLRGTKGNRTVGIDAHLDTVFPKETDVKVKQRGDTLVAPGIGDDTRGLAMLLTILKTMKTLDIQTEADVLFIGSVGEEGLGDLRGVKALFSDGRTKIDSWISIDGGEIGRVNNKGLGSYRYRVTFKGPGGHSWGAFGLANPHHALGDAIRLFVSAADKFTSTGPKTSYNVGRIGGGTSVNSVPFESWMEIDMRSIEAPRLDSMEALLITAVNTALIDQNRLKRLGADLTVEIEQIGNRPSGELEPSLPLIQRALAATAFFGKRPRLTRGSTNSNIPISLGIPAVTIGRGGIGAFGHSLNEWWLNKDGHKAIQLALLLLVAEAGLDG